jgi:hypothetical protein
MNFDDWTADPAKGTATHVSGFTIRIEGNPKDPSEVYPGKFPEGMSFVDQARLLRSGLGFLARSGEVVPKSWQSSNPVQDAKMEALKARQELAKQFAERPDKPQRAVLSLKKNS